MAMLKQLGSLLSRAINVLFLGGVASQTTSARTHLDPELSWLKPVLNFFDKDHCKASWEREVQNAIKTLEKNKRNPYG
jgi:hypothetical protein